MNAPHQPLISYNESDQYNLTAWVIAKVLKWVYWASAIAFGVAMGMSL